MISLGQLQIDDQLSLTRGNLLGLKLDILAVWQYSFTTTHWRGRRNSSEFERHHLVGSEIRDPNCMIIGIGNVDLITNDTEAARLIKRGFYPIGLTGLAGAEQCLATAILGIDYLDLMIV